jgi:hypothetical protein
MGGLFCVASLLAGACGGSSTDGDSAANVALEDLPKELASVTCEVVDQCFAGAYSVISGGEDCNTSITRSIEDGEFGLVQRAVDAGEVTYDPSAVSGCLDAVRSAGCAIFTQRLGELCADVLVGAVASGGDCTISVQCQSGLFCKTDAACPGTCTALLAAGQACEDDDQCQSGLLCSGDTGRCIVPAKKGQACGGGTEPPCPPDLVCQGDDDTTPGTCRAFADVFVKGEGSSCDIMGTDLCSLGLSCAVVGVNADNSLDMQCAQPASSGGACHLAIPEHCPSGEFCELQPQSVDGTCRPTPTDGQPCGVQSPDQGATVCAAEHVCINGTCQALQRLGAPCQIADTCYSGVCTSGGCAPTHCADAG